MTDTSPDTPAPATDAAIPAAPRYTSLEGRPRTESVPLSWPIDYDGKVWTEIVVHRMTARDLRDFYAGGATGPLPMFDAPPAVMDALDLEDDARVREVARSFLPLHMAQEMGGPLPSALPTGEASSPLSARA